MPLSDEDPIGGNRLLASSCVEGRHDECTSPGAKQPMKVCGCPCHGQYGSMCRRCWRERTRSMDADRRSRLPKMVRETEGPCGFCPERIQRERESRAEAEDDKRLNTDVLHVVHTAIRSRIISELEGVKTVIASIHLEGELTSGEKTVLRRVYDHLLGRQRRLKEPANEGANDEDC